MPQKEVFWQKIFLNFMHVFKSAILAEWKNCQNGTFERVYFVAFSQLNLSNSGKGKSFSGALILASTNQKYDERLFMVIS